MKMYEELIVTGAWWDYVDDIASHRVGPILRDHPATMRRKMLSWSKSPDLWKRRTSIICQLGFKEATDLELLYACIEPSLGSRSSSCARQLAGRCGSTQGLIRPRSKICTP